MRKHERKNLDCIGALWTRRRHIIGSIGKAIQTLRTYDVGGKLLNGIKSIYAGSIASVRVKLGELECFMIDNGVRKGVSCSLGF